MSSQKRYLFFFTGLDFVFCVNEIKKNPKFEIGYHFAALFAQSSTFRKIYKVSPTNAVEATFFLPKNFNLWMSFLYLSKNGRSIPEEDKTHIEIMPLSFGFKYNIVLNFFDFSLGVGPCYSWLRIKDKSEFVDQITKKQNLGAMFKANIKYRVKKLYFSVFLDYFFQHFHFSTKNEGIKRHSTDVGGLLLGFGIGKSF